MYGLREGCELSFQKIRQILVQEVQDVYPRQCATEGKEKCKRDFVHYLRLINYSLVVGGTGPLDELAINGQREVYKALSIDPGTYVAGFTQMRNDGCAPRDLSPQALTEYNAALDYVINSLA